MGDFKWISIKTKNFPAYIFLHLCVRKKSAIFTIFFHSPLTLTSFTYIFGSRRVRIFFVEEENVFNALMLWMHSTLSLLSKIFWNFFILRENLVAPTHMLMCSEKKIHFFKKGNRTAEHLLLDLCYFLYNRRICVVYTERKVL